MHTELSIDRDTLGIGGWVSRAEEISVRESGRDFMLGEELWFHAIQRSCRFCGDILCWVCFAASLLEIGLFLLAPDVNQEEVHARVSAYSALCTRGSEGTRPCAHEPG